MRNNYHLIMLHTQYSSTDPTRCLCSAKKKKKKKRFLCRLLVPKMESLITRGMGGCLRRRQWENLNGRNTLHVKLVAFYYQTGSRTHYRAKIRQWNWPVPNFRFPVHVYVGDLIPVGRFYCTWNDSWYFGFISPTETGTTAPLLYQS